MDNYENQLQQTIQSLSKFSNEYQTDILLKSDLQTIVELVEKKMEIQNINEQISLINDLQKDIQSLSQG